MSPRHMRIAKTGRCYNASIETCIERVRKARALGCNLSYLGIDSEMSKKISNRVSAFTKSESRKFNRLYFSGASEIECDKQGRILIPKYLKDYAAIKRDVMVIGVSDRIEVWAKDAWLEYYNSSKESFEEIAEKMTEES